MSFLEEIGVSRQELRVLFSEELGVSPQDVHVFYQVCLPGTYQPKTGAISYDVCLNCPISTYMPASGFSYFDDCPTGYSFINGASAVLTSNLVITGDNIEFAASSLNKILK
ncbi:unnamed protein product [Didymodactylos carnosus]|uniref:Uncharacterized protein n=1 Tax=Didymodactylos carnosus TaxID=1234261 RepID=A0A814JSB9_9BILA|nr:unnamed protein product [Didymodactylos carnosus]CAF1041872.1 unnamed protein product [Didymodactylos carnosus]CAF3763074.1 unnamed protein product [Didymodactylos carnosus]CAF3812063.1 unnamed protein product [Didymodactylos carnosus]